MNVNDVYPSKNDHLKAGDLQGHQVKVTIEGMEIAEFTEGNKIVLKFAGKDKTMVMNKTNSRKVAEYYGDDTDGWMGKEIVIYPDKTEFNNAMVDCLRVRVEAPMATDDDDIPGFQINPTAQGRALIKATL